MPYITVCDKNWQIIIIIRTRLFLYNFQGDHCVNFLAHADSLVHFPGLSGPWAENQVFYCMWAMKRPTRGYQNSSNRAMWHLVKGFLPWIFGINKEKEQVSACVVFRSELVGLMRMLLCELCNYVVKAIRFCWIKLNWCLLCKTHTESFPHTCVFFQVGFWQVSFQTGWRRGHPPAGWCCCLQHPQ